MEDKIILECFLLVLVVGDILASLCFIVCFVCFVCFVTLNVICYLLCSCSCYCFFLCFCVFVRQIFKMKQVSNALALRLEASGMFLNLGKTGLK